MGAYNSALKFNTPLSQADTRGQLCPEPVLCVSLNKQVSHNMYVALHYNWPHQQASERMPVVCFRGGL